MYENINTLLTKFGTISEDYQNIEAAVDELKSQIKKLDYKMFQLRKKNSASIQSLESTKRKSQDAFSDEKLGTIMDKVKAEHRSLNEWPTLLKPWHVLLNPHSMQITALSKRLHESANSQS